MSYNKSDCGCNNCGKEIEDGDEVIHETCHRKSIEELEEQIGKLEKEIDRL